MGFENAALFLGDLDAQFPLTDDPVAQGDDHIRKLKDVLQLTFPGFSRAIDSYLIPYSETDSRTVGFLLEQILSDVAILNAYIYANPNGTPLFSGNNLSDVADVAQARANLGVIGVGDALLRTNNLSDILDAAVARTNLGVAPATDVLLKAQNLADIPDKVLARQNLGVAEEAALLKVAQNLADVANASIALANLGGAPLSEVLLKTNNLSDLVSVPTARTNLGVYSTTETDLAISNAIAVALANFQASVYQYVAGDVAVNANVNLVVDTESGGPIEITLENAPVVGSFHSALAFSASDFSVDNVTLVSPDNEPFNGAPGPFVVNQPGDFYVLFMGGATGWKVVQAQGGGGQNVMLPVGTWDMVGVGTGPMTPDNGNALEVNSTLIAGNAYALYPQPGASAWKLIAGNAVVSTGQTGQKWSKMVLPVLDPGDNSQGMGIIFVNGSATIPDIIATIQNAPTPVGTVTHMAIGVFDATVTAIYALTPSFQIQIISNSSAGGDNFYVGLDYDTGEILGQLNAGPVVALATDVTSAPDGIQVVFLSGWDTPIPAFLAGSVEVEMGTADGGRIPFEGLGPVAAPVDAEDGKRYEITTAGSFNGTAAEIGDWVEFYDNVSKIFVYHKTSLTNNDVNNLISSYMTTNPPVSTESNALISGRIVGVDQAPPITPPTRVGDAVLVGNPPVGPWAAAQVGDLAVWNGTSWELFAPDAFEGKTFQLTFGSDVPIFMTWNSTQSYYASRNGVWYPGTSGFYGYGIINWQQVLDAGWIVHNPLTTMLGSGNQNEYPSGTGYHQVDLGRADHELIKTGGATYINFGGTYSGGVQRKYFTVWNNGPGPIALTIVGFAPKNILAGEKRTYLVIWDQVSDLATVGPRVFDISAVNEDYATAIADLDSRTTAVESKVTRIAWTRADLPAADMFGQVNLSGTWLIMDNIQMGNDLLKFQPSCSVMGCGPSSGFTWTSMPSNGAFLSILTNDGHLENLRFMQGYSSPANGVVALGLLDNAATTIRQVVRNCEFRCEIGINATHSATDSYVLIEGCKFVRSTGLVQQSGIQFNGGILHKIVRSCHFNLDGSARGIELGYNALYNSYFVADGNTFEVGALSQVFVKYFIGNYAHDGIKILNNTIIGGNTSNYLIGFSPSSSYALCLNNTYLKDTSPKGAFFLQENGTPTVVVANTWAFARNAGATAMAEDRFTFSTDASNSKLTYNGTGYAVDCLASARGSIYCTVAGDRVRIGIAKNGTVIPGIDIPVDITVANALVPFAIEGYAIGVQGGDIFELYVKSSGSNDVYVQTCQMRVEQV